MNRSTLNPLLTVLMLVAVSPAIAAAQTLVVEVDNDARISEADLARMERLVDRSYLAIGVRVTWVHGKVPLDDPRGLRVHLWLFSRMRADRKIATEQIGGDVLGRGNRQARIAYIFPHRVGEASRKYGREYTRVLGFVAAHELGHVLLPAQSHSEKGIMKSHVNLLVGTIADEFTPEEGEAIRDGLARQTH